MPQLRPIRSLLPSRSAGLSDADAGHAVTRRPVEPTPAEETVVNSAVYRDGRKTATPATLSEALARDRKSVV